MKNREAGVWERERKGGGRATISNVTVKEGVGGGTVLGIGGRMVRGWGSTLNDEKLVLVFE